MQIYYDKDCDLSINSAAAPPLSLYLLQAYYYIYLITFSWEAR